MRVEILRSIFSKEKCEDMVLRMEESIRLGETRRELPTDKAKNNSAKGINAYSIHELFAEEQEEYLFDISQVVGKVLLPTYNFSRKYLKGSILRKHQDRPACEHSLTINFGIDKKPWAFYCEIDGKEVSVDLYPGDGLYYTGQDVPHWRLALETEYCYQTFFHYVDKDGNCRNESLEGMKRIREHGVHGFKND